MCLDIGPPGFEPGPNVLNGSSTRFDVMRVGESQEYPMFGLVFRKLS